MIVSLALRITVSVGKIKAKPLLTKNEARHHRDFADVGMRSWVTQNPVQIECCFYEVSKSQFPLLGRRRYPESKVGRKHEACRICQLRTFANRPGNKHFPGSFFLILLVLSLLAVPQLNSRGSLWTEVICMDICGLQGSVYWGRKWARKCGNGPQAQMELAGLEATDIYILYFNTLFHNSLILYVHL